MHLFKYNGKTFAALFTNTELYIFLKIIVLQRHLAMTIIDFIITSTKIEYLEMKGGFLREFSQSLRISSVLYFVLSKNCLL